MSAYSVHVVVSSNGTTYNLDVPSGDDTDGNVTPTYGLADPLVIKQSIPANGDKGIQAHPAPDEATITVIAADSTTYGFALGDPVSIKVYPQAAYAGTPVTFYGRIATLSADPHDLGVRYTLGCLDYTADLAELPVGDTVDWPQESAAARVSRIFTEAGIGGASPFRLWEQSGATWLVTTSPTQAFRAKSRTDAYTALIATLDSWPFLAFTDELGAGPTGTTHAAGYRPRVVPVISGDLLDVAGPFRTVVGAPRSRRMRYAPPGRLTTVAGKLTVTMDAADSSPSTGAPILDGGRVEFAPTFTQTKGGGLANVITATDSAGGTYTYDWRTWTSYAYGSPATYVGSLPSIDLAGPSTVQTISTQIDPVDGAGAAVMVYRCPFRPDLRAAWEPSGIRWELWAEPTPWRRPELTELLTIARAQASRMPPNREWVSGLVSSTKLTVAGGRPVLDIELQPVTYDYDQQSELLGASLGVVRFDSPVLTGVTLAQLSTRDTLADYSLTRGS
jgi:hypothetical protein